MPKRDFSVDVLKFLAALLITNSHMEILYGEYSFMATGGAIGDALFFFCSGYTLFLGRNASFFNWYKRRINRKHPVAKSEARVMMSIPIIRHQMIVLSQRTQSRRAGLMIVSGLLSTAPRAENEGQQADS